mmetsp:Transcript_25748/g.33738  ORF Transcript_25748/g.33738 Transcript_25748/m.33738 type:complete len:1268 (-) Transcript_25748:328-4131(-)
MIVLKDIFTQDEVLSDSYEQCTVQDSNGTALNGVFQIKLPVGDEQSLIEAFGYQEMVFPSKDEFKTQLTDFSRRVRAELKGQGVGRERIKQFMSEAPHIVKYLISEFDSLKCYTGKSATSESCLLFRRQDADGFCSFIFVRWGLAEEEVQAMPPPPPGQQVEKLAPAQNGHSGGAVFDFSAANASVNTKIKKKTPNSSPLTGIGQPRKTTGKVGRSPELSQRKALEGPLFTPEEEKFGQDLAAEIVEGGMFRLGSFLVQLKSNLEEKEAPPRVLALSTYLALCQSEARWIEPFLVSLVESVLGSHAHKDKRVGSAAEEVAIKMLETKFNGKGLSCLLEVIYRGMAAYAWQTKEASLRLLARLAEYFPEQMGECLPDIIDHILVCVRDTKRSTKATALQVFEEVVRAVMTNPDVLPIVNGMIDAYENPVMKTTTALDLLTGTTFVSRVDAPTLGLLVPILNRGMNEKKSQWKRVSALIMGNMCKLVYNPKDAVRFFPVIEPVLQKGVSENAFEEVRDVCEMTLGFVKRLVDEAEKRTQTNHTVFWRRSDMLGALKEAIAKFKSQEEVDAFEARSPRSDSKVFNELHQYVAALCFQLVNDEDVNEASWRDCMLPYLTSYLAEEDAVSVCNELRHMANIVGDANADDADEGEDICKTEFSLAYGGKILLHNTYLHLKRGRRYGLVGKNGVGKTTLMRNIASRAIDGLPEELNTVYVQHDIVGDEAEDSVLNYMLVTARERNYDETHCIGILEGVGFTEEMRAGPINSLSGGWKMKLALARAMIMDADLLLLDEPTNHLDSNAVAWLTKYLQKMDRATALIVSHSTSFLDDVCTDIIHYEQQKLVRYIGNLSKFVERRPEARSYYELSADSLVFRFPPPGPLEGIRSQTAAILKMEDVTFTYPGATIPQLRNVNIKLCLASRVALIGPNGAGKSTLIKLLVGETKPDGDIGKVWRHHNLRIAYVAQHSFHHVEQHLEESPVAYMQWRFGGGEDKEIMNQEALKLTDEEQSQLEGKKWGDVKALVGRRRRARKLEYEVTFVDRPEKDNKYMTIDELEAMGFSNLIKQFDEKVKARTAGLDIRPTTTREIQKHLDDFGLEQEFGTYGKIKGLSGGQKVKLVLAAAMWNCPHLMVLDEPTNYLDREALGAFATAIKQFAGGVIMISHDKEFYSELCNENWHLVDGECLVEGEAEEIEGVVMRKKKTEEKELSSSGKKMVGNINQAIEHKVTTDFFGKTLSKKDVRALEKLQKVNDVEKIRKLLKIPRGKNFQGY